MYIAPEEMVGDRRSGMQRTVKTQATEYVPQRRNENRIKTAGFSPDLEKIYREHLDKIDTSIIISI